MKCSRTCRQPRLTGVGWVVLAYLLAPVPAVLVAQTTINVEIDYMADAIHSHAPTQAEIAAVIQMFACHNITLNAVVDDQIPHGTVMQCNKPGQDDFFTCSATSSFKSIKDAHFDHAGGGWHYCVFGHDYDDGGGTGSSGLAEPAGDDFVVTLGSFSGGVGTDWDRAATFAHELGHNLGLTHNGGQPGTGSFKPNYPSIMSYRHQLLGVRGYLICQGLSDPTCLFKELDYSDGRLPSIDENALSESLGVGIHNVDWDCDGTLDSATLSRNVDDSASWCASSGSLTALSDYNDWAHIVDYAAGAKADLTPKARVHCVTASEVKVLMHLVNPRNCVPVKPPAVSEAPVTGLMIWVNPSYSGTQTGTGDNPYNRLFDAYVAAPSGSVLYLQSGTYTNSGVTMTLAKPLTLAGPGVATIDP
jgi:hypothetical protein